MAWPVQERSQAEWREAYRQRTLERDRLREFVDWLLSMDDPEDVLGRADRQTVTLTQIIEKARSARSGEEDS